MYAHSLSLSRFLVIKRNAIFDRFEEEQVVLFKDMCGTARAERNKVIVPVLEEQGVSVSTKPVPIYLFCAVVLGI